MVQIYENLDLDQHFWKILIEVKIFEISQFWPKFWKLTIFVKIFENLDFSEYFPIISILVKIVGNIDCGQNFRKAILVKLAKISSLGLIFEKSRFYSKHLDFGPNFLKFWFWSKSLKDLDRSQNVRNISKFRNIAILVKTFEDLDFDEDFRNTSILVTIVENIDFRENFRDVPILVKIFEKYRFYSDFRKISIYV